MKNKQSDHLKTEIIAHSSPNLIPIPINIDTLTQHIISSLYTFEIRNKF